MVLWLKYLLIAVVGYFLGNISVGILISRAYGVKDIRTRGSGNAGTTNVLRTLGWVPSVLTLVGDCLKGFLAAELGNILGGEIGMLIGGTCAIIGHDFPVVFHFKGGKGIATSLGLILALNPWIALVLTVLVVGVAATLRYMSVGSVAAAVLYTPLVAIFMRGSAYYGAQLGFAAFASLLALFCHRKNIARLIRGEENRLDFEKISRISQKLKNIRK